MIGAPTEAFTAMPRSRGKSDHRIEVVLGVIGNDLVTEKPWPAENDPDGAQRADTQQPGVAHNSVKHVTCQAWAWLPDLG